MFERIKTFCLDVIASAKSVGNKFGTWFTGTKVGKAIGSFIKRYLSPIGKVVLDALCCFLLAIVVVSFLPIELLIVLSLAGYYAYTTGKRLHELDAKRKFKAEKKLKEAVEKVSQTYTDFEAKFTTTTDGSKSPLKLSDDYASYLF